MSYVTTALQRCQGRFSGDLQLGEVCVSSPPLICSSESSVECLCGIHYLQFSEYRLLDVVWQRCLPYKSIFHFDLHGLVKPKRGGGDRTPRSMLTLSSTIMVSHFRDLYLYIGHRLSYSKPILGYQSQS